MKKIYIVIGILFLFTVIGIVTYFVITNKKSTNIQDTSTEKKTDNGCSDNKPCPENQTCVSGECKINCRKNDNEIIDGYCANPTQTCITGECKTTYFCGSCEPKQAP